MAVEIKVSLTDEGNILVTNTSENLSEDQQETATLLMLAVTKGINELKEMIENDK